MLTINNIINIVEKYSRPKQLKKIRENGVYDFYALNGIMVQLNRVKTLSPFFKMTEKAFNPENITLPQFKKFIKGLSKMLHETNYKLDSLLKIKGQIKKYLLQYNKENSQFYKEWLRAGLNISDIEFKEKKEKANNAVELKNKQVFRIPINVAIKFYKSIFDTKNKDLIDYIIASQASLGCRLIEILNSNVSKFEIYEDNKIKQIGTAKESNKDKIIIKEPINLTTAENVIEWIRQVRLITDTQNNVGNIKLSEIYTNNVNKRIVFYLGRAGMYNPELKSSHGLRRLYVSYSYYTKKEPEETFCFFIKRNLGHETCGSVMNYNSIQITEEKKEPEENKETEEKKESGKSKTLTELKFDKIEKLIEKGITSYDDMQKHQISRYMYAKYRKKKALFGKIHGGSYCNIDIEIIDEIPKEKEYIKPQKAKTLTELKFDKIEKLMEQGNLTYKQIQKHGITTNLFSQYKKMKGLPSYLE